MQRLIFAGLIVGSLIAGFCIGAAHSQPAAADKPAATASLEATKLAKAEKQIADLKRKLSAAKAENDKLARQLAKPAVAKPVAGKKSDIVLSAGADVDILDEMKKKLSAEDFKKATNALVRLKANMAAKAKSKLEFLKSIDVTGMTKAERDNHKKFIGLVEQRESIRSKMKLGIPDQKTMEELVTAEMQLSILAKKERATLSRQLATELGYTGDDAEAICDAVKNIHDCTGNGLDNMMEMVEDAQGDGAGAKIQMMAL